MESPAVRGENRRNAMGGIRDFGSYCRRGQVGITWKAGEVNLPCRYLLLRTAQGTDLGALLVIPHTASLRK